MNISTLWLIITMFLISVTTLAAQTTQPAAPNIFNPGHLQSTDSAPSVKIGDPAPNFTLPSINGDKVTLSDFKGKKNIVLAFVPAAFTPVCSQQWPGYNITKEYFDKNDAVLLGISVDNIPSLFAWTRQMGDLWFPVLSDFWPHGAVAKEYGILRSDGTAERAIFVIDKLGIIRYIDVHDINTVPKLEDLLAQLEKVNR
jgi:peroxiredoxin